MHRTLIAAMSAVPVLAGIATTEISRLADAGMVHRFRRGTYLCHQGDASPDVYFLVDGRVEISSISATGSRVLHASVDSPQFLGELGVLGDLPRTADVLTLDDSDVWSAPGDETVRTVVERFATHLG